MVNWYDKNIYEELLKCVAPRYENPTFYDWTVTRVKSNYDNWIVELKDVKRKPEEVIEPDNEHIDGFLDTFKIRGEE